MQVSTLFKTATLDKPENVGAGFVHDEEQNSLLAYPFVGCTGNVVECDDPSYDTDRPTGEEELYYLVDFDGQKVWVESGALTLKL